MPAKGKIGVTDVQRRKMAAGRLAGKTAKQVARETGLAVQTIYNHAHDPRTTTFVLRARAKSERQLERGWKLALASILRHLRSHEPELEIQARRDLLRYATAGDPPLLRMAPMDADRGNFTLEQLLMTYRKVTVSSE